MATTTFPISAHVALTDALIASLYEGSKDLNVQVQDGDFQRGLSIKTSPKDFDPLTDDPYSVNYDELLTVQSSRPSCFDNDDWRDACSAMRSAVEARLEADGIETGCTFVQTEFIFAATWLTGETILGHECEVERRRRAS